MPDVLIIAGRASVTGLAWPDRETTRLSHPVRVLGSMASSAACRSRHGQALPTERPGSPAVESV
jgi:hypothetical protein